MDIVKNLVYDSFISRLKNELKVISITDRSSKFEIADSDMMLLIMPSESRVSVALFKNAVRIKKWSYAYKDLNNTWPEKYEDEYREVFRLATYSDRYDALVRTLKAVEFTVKEWV